jgi:hypothetical protein
MIELGKYSIGIGDRFGYSGGAQLSGLSAGGVELGYSFVPVWNKSYREHQLVGSVPADTRAAADRAVSELFYDGEYHVDADHITLKTVDDFISCSDFFTIDVADYIGVAADEEAIVRFIKSFSGYVGELRIPGIASSFAVTEDLLREIGLKFLRAIEEAGVIYRRIVSGRGVGTFITEVSMDEVLSSQGPLELFFILGGLASEGIPVQTIAPKFSGRFNKGVDYVGDVDLFAHEFESDILVLRHAVTEFGLPADLKLSIHSGSDKYSLYAAIGVLLRRHDSGIHLKTAGTTWLSEVIGLCRSGDAEAIDMVKAIYSGALLRYEELCAPYASVIDIDRGRLPAGKEMELLSGEELCLMLYNDVKEPKYNSAMRQLMHVAYRLAAEYGEEYTRLLVRCAGSSDNEVMLNIVRHLRGIFG